MKRWEGSISSNLAWLETNVKCVQKVNTKSPSYHLRLQVATLASIKIKVKNILEEKASIGWLAGKISGLSTVAWYNAGQNGHRLLSKLKHFIFGPPPQKKNTCILRQRFHTFPRGFCKDENLAQMLAVFPGWHVHPCDTLTRYVKLETKHSQGCRFVPASKPSPAKQYLDL